jgi:photosystem II stability/assembly factor-like uncharacterized protein
VGRVTRLAAATGSGVAVLAEEAGAWTATVTPLPSASCVAADPLRPDTLFAGGRGGGLVKSDDGGASWADQGLPNADVFSVAVSAVDGIVYAGCEPSSLFRSADGGRTWEELEALREIPSAPSWSFPPRPWTSHVRWIAPSPNDAAVILVGIELGGLMYTRDGGATWMDHRPGAQRDVHSLAWHPHVPGRAYEAGGGGAAWSVDGGLTWEPADEGRDRHYTWAVAVDPGDPDCWYVSASPGPRHAHRKDHAEAFIYRRRNGAPWERLAGGLPQPLEAMPYALLALPGGLLAGLADGRLYSSEDAGDTWSELELAGDDVPSVVALALLEGELDS